jgi:uncharacterized protein YhdP
MAGSLLDQLSALHGQLRRLREEVDSGEEQRTLVARRLRDLAGYWRGHGPVLPIDLEEARLKTGADS